MVVLIFTQNPARAQKGDIMTLPLDFLKVAAAELLHAWLHLHADVANFA
jgi:hypothetical protein